jgi:transcriptional regulator with XRE-family HTH domain
MRTPQELRGVILELLKERKQNTHQMLKKCGYNSSLVNDLKKGQMPSADKLANIAVFLGVSSEFLLGVQSAQSVQSESKLHGISDNSNNFESSDSFDNSDADLIENLRREFYGNPATALTEEDKRNILEIVRVMLNLKSVSAQKRERAD